MKRLHAFLVFSLIGFCFGLFANEIAEKMHEPKHPQNIRILLKQNATEGLVEVKGAYFIHDPSDGSRLSSGMFGKRYLVRSTKDGIKWGETFPGIHQIAIIPKSANTSILIDGIQYNGIIAIYKVGNKLHFVNEISIEAFLKSTLSQQFPYSYEDEVMAALAIAARTTAYFHVNKDIDSFWHLEKKNCQYQGSAMIIPDAAIVKAIDATRDMILVTSHEGKHLPFAATWTDHCAGKTAAFQNIFRKDFLAPACSVESPHAALDREDAKWSYSIEKKKLADLFGLNDIIAVDLFLENTANKVYALRLKDAHTSYDLDFFKFIKKLGKENIQSTDFTVTINKNQVIFQGFGKGSGVGLCIHSAIAMAQNATDSNINAIEILRKFFPGSRLLNLSAKPIIK